MNTLLTVLLSNAAITAGMFAALYACKPWIRNPALLHLLWVLVLVKLWMPPIWTPELAWLPEAQSAASADSRATRSMDAYSPSGPIVEDDKYSGRAHIAPALAANLETAGDADSTSRTWRGAALFSPARLAVAVWLTGMVLWLALALWRIARFQRCLRFAWQADAEVQETAARLAAQIGLRHCPPVCLVPGRVSPMLWTFFSPARVIVPSELFARLNHGAREALLLHELAHFRRGDHWVRLLELVSLAAYWWYPLTWLVRREIRAAEERACDAWVVSQRPGDRRNYAATLVETLGFLSASALPPAASGVGATTDIERRLTMIMRERIESRVSRRAKAVLCLLALLLLPLAPALVRAQRVVDEARPQDTQSETAELGHVPETEVGRIEGRVVDAASGKPLAGQLVLTQAQDQKPGPGYYGRAVADDDGRFVLGGLAPGRFNVLFGGRERGTDSERALTAPAHEGIDVVAGKAVAVEFRASPGRRLRGKVVDAESGEPLAKIHVGYYGPARPDSGAACLMVQTEADGSFEFRVPPGVSRLYVAEGNRTSVSDSTRTLEVPSNRDLERIVLRAGPKIPPGKYAERAAAATSKDAKPSGTEQIHATLKLQPPAGRPVNQVHVRTVFRGSQHASQWSAHAGTEFSIAFHRREQGRRAFFLIEAAGFTPVRSAEFVVGEHMPEIAVALVPEELVPIRGRVLGPQGNVAAGARVRVGRRIYGYEQQFPWGLEYTTDAEGRFEIKHARLGDKIRFRIDQPGTGGADSDWIMVDTRDPRTLPDLRLGLLDQELGGTVLDYQGLPVADAKVMHAGEPRVEAKTDAAGKFRLEGLPAGEVQLAIVSAGFPRELRQAQAGQLDNELRVDRLSEKDRNDYQMTLSLRPPDDQIVPRATLFVCINGGPLLMSMPDRQRNSHQVRFARFARLHRDKQFSVVVAAEGYALSEPVVVPNRRRPSSVTVDLELAAPVRVLGRVVDEQGQPVSGAKVGLSVSLNEQAVHEPWAFIGREKLPLTDAEGRFEIPGVWPKSRVAVYVNKAGYAGVWSQRVSIDGSKDLQLPGLILPPATGEVSGRVVDAQDHPVEGAIVLVHDLGGVETTSDSSGRFRLQQVPSREVLLRVLSEHGEWAKRITPDARGVEVKLETRR